jgi:hypothetical protein
MGTLLYKQEINRYWIYILAQQSSEPEGWSNTDRSVVNSEITITARCPAPISAEPVGCGGD